MEMKNKILTISFLQHTQHCESDGRN